MAAPSLTAAPSTAEGADPAISVRSPALPRHPDITASSKNLSPGACRGLGTCAGRRDAAAFRSFGVEEGGNPRRVCREAMQLVILGFKNSLIGLGGVG